MRIDAHVHISLFPNREQLLLKLNAFKIKPIAVSCNLKDAKENQVLAKKIPFNFQVGIHPWYIDNSSFDEVQFKELLSSPLCVGIGECGLDANIQNPLQLEILKRQLDLASLLCIPVSFHVYKRHNELLQILSSYQGKITGLIHGFTSSRQIAKAYLDLGMYLSLGRNLVSLPSKLPELLKFIPQDRILLESDADYKYKRDYDFNLVTLQYDLLASHLKLDKQALEDLLYKNLGTLFGKKILL